MSGHHDGAISSGPGFIHDAVGDIAFMSQLERDMVERKSGLPESFHRRHQDGIFDGAFSAYPFFLVLAELFAEMVFRLRVLRAAVLHQFPRHGVQHMKQCYIHVLNVPEQRADIVQGAGGLVLVIVGDKNVLGRGVAAERLFRCEKGLVTRCLGRHSITMRVQE